ncbi:cytochrome b5 family heme steroid binding domain-containing protein [Cystoisospora suis]|uniref:Cytochrome b5 family heme steroid binding domain-containing protein n=1 Tax=Cystoisospora suis TaxID=483139 RepID=A0A2C6KMF2_9APIC|nr:cytochrome b5 family heme steroid binding domain-containing protein [Cystoisospora suis]
MATPEMAEPFSSSSSSFSCPSSSCVFPVSGKFSVTLLQRKRGASPESFSPTCSSATSPPSSFRALEKLSYVWQRQDGSLVEDLVKEFEMKMKSLLLSYEPRDASLDESSLHLVVQHANIHSSLIESFSSSSLLSVSLHCLLSPQGHLEEEHGETSLTDLRSLFFHSPHSNPPSHIQVYLSSPPRPPNLASAQPTSACSKPAFLFFSPHLPFTPPSSRVNLPREEKAAVYSPDQKDSPSSFNSPSSHVCRDLEQEHSDTGDVTSSSSSCLARAFAGLSVQTPPPQITVPPGSDFPERMKAVRRHGGMQENLSSSGEGDLSEQDSKRNEGTQSSSKKKNGQVKKTGNSSSLVVPAGYGSAGQARFRELMASNKNTPPGAASSLSGEETVRRISLEELSRHKSRENIWVALDGDVYDITQYLSFHPGGARILLDYGGKDVSEAFRRYHPWVNAKHILAYNRVGILE